MNELPEAFLDLCVAHALGTLAPAEHAELERYLNDGGPEYAAALEAMTQGAIALAASTTAKMPSRGLRARVVDAFRAEQGGTMAGEPTARRRASDGTPPTHGEPAAAGGRASDGASPVVVVRGPARRRSEIPPELRYEPAAIHDEPPTTRDEPPAMHDEPLTTRDESPGMRDEPLTMRDELLTTRDEPLTMRDELLTTRDEPPGMRDEPLAMRDEPLATRGGPSSMSAAPAQPPLERRTGAKPLVAGQPERRRSGPPSAPPRRQADWRMWAAIGAGVVLAIIAAWSLREAGRMHRESQTSRVLLSQAQAKQIEERRWTEVMTAPNGRVAMLQPTPEGAAQMRARVTFDPKTHSAVFVFVNLAPPEKHVYQLWSIEGQGVASRGVIHVDAEGRGVMRLENAGNSALLDGFGVSLEPTGGSPFPDKPSGAVVMVGKFSM